MNLPVSDPAMSDPAIDESLVRELLAEQFPHWAELPIVPVDASGLDNATYRLGDTLSVRLPRYPRWTGQVEREHRWLPRLAPHLPLAVSTPVAKGEPSADYPFPWSVYRWIDGATATPDGVDLLDAAMRLGDFVAALQRIDPAGGPGPEWSNAFRGVPMGDPRDSLAVEERVRPKLDGLADVDPAIDVGAVTAVWEAALAAPPWSEAPVWIHGDLAPGNLLMEAGRLSAVIDFGTLAVGDPACDLLPAWVFFEGSSRELFRERLGVDDATWARGRGWGLAASLPSLDDPYYDDPVRVARALRQLDALVAEHRSSG